MMPEFTKEAFLEGVARWLDEDGPIPHREARAYLDSLKKAGHKPEPKKERTPEEILEECATAYRSSSLWKVLAQVRELRQDCGKLAEHNTELLRERDELRRRIEKAKGWATYTSPANAARLERTERDLGWDDEDAVELAAIRAEVEAIAEEMREADRADGDIDTGGLIDGLLADDWADRLARRSDDRSRGVEGDSKGVVRR